MTYTFSTAEVEDGTGKSGALVFEQPTATASWLSDRGKTSFSGAADASQQAAALKATEELTDQLMHLGFKGRKLLSTQALIFPSEGAYRQDNELILSGTIPDEFLEAYRLAAEECAADTWMPSRSAAGIKREDVDGNETEYMGDSTGIDVNHPEIFARLRRLVR